jgi:L-asparaginase
MMKPSVAVLALGGTIAMTQGTQAGVVPTLTGEMLVAAVPGLAELADIESRSFRQMPGAHLQFQDLEALADAVCDAAAKGARGIVVTQGTDTIEETAFALDRLLGLDTPVVVTGAMRNPTVPGADGPANLLAAVQVAISDAARGQGCLVVMNDEIHAARFVRKIHTSSPAAFSSPLAGPVGWISEGNVRVPVQIKGEPCIRRAGDARNARVALITVALGDDGALIRAAVDGGFDGLVVEATGGGHVSPAVADALGEAAGRIPVVLASRAGTGEILSRTYGFQGSEIDLQRRGLIRAGWLDGLKAKVLLTLLLRHGQAERDAIVAAFHPWGGSAVPPK